MNATAKRFREYLKSLGLDFFYTEENKHSFEATMYCQSVPSIADFTQISRDAFGRYVARLAKKDLDNKEITKGFFEDKEVNLICFGVINLTKEQAEQIKTLTKVKEMSGQARIAVYVLGDVFVGEVPNFNRGEDKIELLNYNEFIDRLKQVL